MSLQTEILDFWFGPEDSPEYGKDREAWFKKDADFDAEIQRRFGDAVADAINGTLEDMANSPKGALALIILLDQFTRNIYRGDPRSFAGDDRALRIAKEAVAAGWDRDLPPTLRSFVYLPYEHSEALEDQDTSIYLFKNFGAEGKLEWAVKHRDIIVRFGRFPHRNAVLGRKTTPEEAEFLTQPNSSF
ncbi:MAG: DUF924 family protein [Magnetospiraceae bacterium]